MGKEVVQKDLFILKITQSNSRVMYIVPKWLATSLKTYKRRVQKLEKVKMTINIENSEAIYEGYNADVIEVINFIQTKIVPTNWHLCDESSLLNEIFMIFEKKVLE